MKSGDTIIQDQQAADDYDRQAQLTGWRAPEAVFGLVYEYVQPGETLLDLGIGSGLSALPFHKAGLRIYGLDGSQEVLKTCAAKGFAAELKAHDLRRLPLPYPDHFCNHITAVAVLNSFQDLNLIFREAARILQPQGIFAFTVEIRRTGQAAWYAVNRVDTDQKAREGSAVRLFRHSEEEIEGWLAGNGLALLKTLKFLAFRVAAENQDVYFTAYAAQKKKQESTSRGKRISTSG